MQLDKNSPTTIHSHFQVAYQCGEIPSGNCKGEPTVINSNNNILRVILPSTMEKMQGPVKHRLEITGVTIPNGGYFPTRVAAQITSDRDTMPHYITSSGDYYWKQPDDGQNIAKVSSYEMSYEMVDFSGFGIWPI